MQAAIAAAPLHSGAIAIPSVPDPDNSTQLSDGVPAAVLSSKADTPVLPPVKSVPKSSETQRTESPQVPLPVVMPAPRKSGAMGGIVAMVLLAAVGLYFVAKPSQKELACEKALSTAAENLTAGNAADARSHATLALASCSGEARSKGVDLQVAIDKVLAAQATCERSFRRIASQIADRRLQSARSALDQLDTTCTESVQGKGLRQQIESGQTAASTSEAEVRKQLENGDVKAATAALDQIGVQNREHPEIAALRQQIQAVFAKSQEAVTPAPAIPVVPSAMPREPTASPQAELMLSFLRDAETAMNQLKFDAAKTYVESARRIAPNNPQAAALARRIKERELEYIRKEMTIN